MRRIILVIAFVIGVGLPVYPQQMTTTVADQVPLLMKILMFERNMPEKIQSKFNIGIVFQSHFRTSNNAATRLQEFRDKNANLMVFGSEVNFIFYDLSENFDLNSFVLRNDIKVLYILPLRAFDLGKLISVARDRKIMTFTGVEKFVHEGLAVGIGVKGDSPEILINLEAAKQEGCDFTSQLLRLVRIVK
ncbi:MAG: YfiR family protein [Ignavibacteria bacterium]|nr:YfiR family protein [Ignavibacteria bacterium]